MTSGDGLSDVLEPVRDLHVSAILHAIAEALDSGAEVDPEPVDRDAEGRMRRSGPLGLPSRSDLRVTKGGRTLLRKATSEPALPFAPRSLLLSDGASARIGPFGWGATPVRLTGAPGAPNWAPLRRWYLEWFQPRFGEESPDLLCVVHALDGPHVDGRGWRYDVDLGSASVMGFRAMLEALSVSGCARIAVGEITLAS
ncbi:MAG: hypothetical protein ACK4WC_02400 [Rubrimonas sp.]